MESILRPTPPKATQTLQFLKAVETANRLLQLSGESDFQSMTFLDDLKHNQQAILMFMIMMFGSLQTSAKVLMKTPRPQSKEFKRMMPFTRCAAMDFPCPSTQTLRIEKFQRGVPQFLTARGVTSIFKKPNRIPFLHDGQQQADSYICSYHVC